MGGGYSVGLDSVAMKLLRQTHILKCILLPYTDVVVSGVDCLNSPEVLNHKTSGMLYCYQTHFSGGANGYGFQKTCIVVLPNPTGW